MQFYIAVGVLVLVVVAVGLARAAWLRAGRDEAKLDAAEKGLEIAKDAKKIDDSVPALSDAQRERLLHRRD